MNSTLNKVLIFAAGAAIGSVVTWKFLKTKYEQLVQEEIASVKEVFSRRNNESADEPEMDQQLAMDFDEKDVAQYNNIVKNEGYTDYSNITKPKQEAVNVVKDDERPYVISPDEFDTIDEYEAVSLTYFADGVLADEWDNVIDEDEIDTLVGEDSLTHFGEYESDAVHVRNDLFKTDYEILLDVRNYGDVERKRRVPKYDGE